MSRHATDRKRNYHNHTLGDRERAEAIEFIEANTLHDINIQKRQEEMQIDSTQVVKQRGQQ